MCKSFKYSTSLLPIDFLIVAIQVGIFFFFFIFLLTNDTETFNDNIDYT